MKDFDAKRILQQPFFKDLNLPTGTDEEIIETFDVTGLKTSAAIEKKLADLHALDDKLKEYRRHVKAEISVLKDKIIERATQGTDVEDDAATLRQLNFIDDAAEIFNLGFGRLFVNIEKILDTQYRKEFGARLKAARQAKGFTQADVARELNISSTGYSKYEQSRADLPLSSFMKILKILNCSANDLITINT